MKIVIFRSNCLLNLFIFAFVFFWFFASFINFFDDNAKLIPSILGTIGMFVFLFFWLWMVLRNYLQIFMFKKDGIYTNEGFKKYLHFDYENIKKIKIVTFNCPPKFEKGEKIRGVDSILSAPKKFPRRWIVITDGRKEDNIYNYSSYLVPIRKHMVIKFKYTKKREKFISEYKNIEIEYQTVSYEEMNKFTPKNKTL